MNEKVTDKARGMFEKATGCVSTSFYYYYSSSSSSSSSSFSSFSLLVVGAALVFVIRKNGTGWDRV